GNVRELQGAGVGSWASTGSGVGIVVGDAGTALLTRDQVGRGEIYFLADVSPLENAYLGNGDNAAFGLALAGDAGRPVVFAEGVHGYGASRGLAAIPDRWKVALILVALAALAFAWSRARRFGPPDQSRRELPPARAEYVQALSISLERTRDHAGALAPARRLVGTCCSKASPASPRRCSRTRSRARSAWSSGACSSPRTCCRPTSRAR